MIVRLTVNCIIWSFSWWGMPPMVMNASSSRFEPISTLALLWYCFCAMSAAGEAVRDTPSIVGPEQQPPGSPGSLPGCSRNNGPLVRVGNNSHKPRPRTHTVGRDLAVGSEQLRYVLGQQAVEPRAAAGLEQRDKAILRVVVRAGALVVQARLDDGLAVERKAGRLRQVIEHGVAAGACVSRVNGVSGGCECGQW